MTRPRARQPDGPAGPPGKSLLGKSMLVTGATDGIGFHTARFLAVRGASVTITGRDTRRGASAAAAIQRAAGHNRVNFVSVDHSTVGANEQLAASVMERPGHLDVLINNVGAEIGHAGAMAGVVARLRPAGQAHRRMVAGVMPKIAGSAAVSWSEDHDGPPPPSPSGGAG